MRWQLSTPYAAAVALLMLAAVTVVASCATEPGGRREKTPERADAQGRCAAGSGPACAELGAALATPDSDDSDFERGVVLLEVACGQHTPHACPALARVYGHSTVAANRARARDLATRGCSRGEADACTVMGEIIRAGDRANFPAISQAFRHACQLGDPRGCELFGLVQWDDDLAGDKVAGLAALERACAGGRLTACHDVGMLRMKDPRTRDAGWDLIAQNCHRGHVPSCSVAAYAGAPLVSETPRCAQVLPYADQACRGGQQNACAVVMACRLRTLGDDPPTVEQLHDACLRRVPLACLYWADQEEAHGKQQPLPDRVVNAYRAACQGGFPAADVACARAAAITLARAKDVTEAEGPLSDLQRACSDSSGEACCVLADAYRDGQGVAADAEKAGTFRDKACQLGASRCCPPGQARAAP